MFVNKWLISLIAAFISVLVAGLVHAAPPPGKGKPGSGGGGGGGFTTISSKDWGETPVRRVLQTFAYGGLATDAQIATWAGMSPQDAIEEILTFNPVNDKLSPPEPGDNNQQHCHSLEAIQNFWNSDDPGNILKYADRKYYATLSTNGNLSASNLQRTWNKVISTRGCNQFLHKMGLYLTNYHASISVHKTRAGLIRSYYDDVLAQLIDNGNFVNVMITAASHAAVSRAYGHQYSRFYNNTNPERFSGTDDFGREFH